VINALHAGDKKESWTECRGRVHQEFNDQISQPSILLVPGLLEKIPVLLFAGDQDFICNYLGIEALISDLTWNGEKGLGVSVFFSFTYR
jgi:carboxypeptidase D